MIPYYNGSLLYLEEAIESVRASTIQADIIVVDDASATILPPFKKDIKLFKHSVNRGLAAARNTGITLANTEWILTLDCDDKIHPSYIERALALQKETGADIISSWLQTFGDYEKIRKPPSVPITFHMLFEQNRINCCSLFSKKMWRKVGGFDEHPILKKGYEDWDFWLRCVRAGYKISVIPEVMFYYRKHGKTLLSVSQRYAEELSSYIQSKHYE